MNRIAQPLNSFLAKHRRAWSMVLALPLLATIFAMPAAQARDGITTIYKFHGVDGSTPKSRLIADPAGNLYGTTFSGGAYGGGTVFKLDPNGNETVLYSFPESAEVNGLVRDGSGKLYGTTYYGGDYANGTVFMLDAAGKYTTLHSFNGNDGKQPNSLIVGPGGYLYGTTCSGGPGNGGVIFRMDRVGNETVLYSGLGLYVPNATLISDGAGNLYGTTPFGGAYGWGTVFKLDSHGNYAVLYDFTNGLDGGYPGTDLVVDSGGNLYGTTLQGGDTECSLGYMGCGVLFKLDPAGNETVLHTFHGGDGAPPYGGLLRNTKTGDLLGTARSGGAYGWGVIFGISSSGTEKVLHSFIGTDGGWPSAGLLAYKGSFYGVTEWGGDYPFYGIVFKFAH